MIGACSRYVLGRADRETMRLAQQAALFEACMGRLLTRGRHCVLDPGSGTGDVLMLAAEMVGPTGRVLGVDSNPAIVSAAQARVQAAGLSHVTFTTTDVRDLQLGPELHQLVGRCVRETFAAGGVELAGRSMLAIDSAHPLADGFNATTQKRLRALHDRAEVRQFGGVVAFQ